MTSLLNFVLSFIMSFVGSIPPGTINLSIADLGLQNKIAIAKRSAIAAAIIEYPYAWIAVTFERLITANPFIVENLQLLTAIVMVVLGSLNLYSSFQPSKFTQRFSNSGFRRGIILGILNPLAIPFWIGVTAYLRAQGWIDLSSNLNLHAYLLGVSLGAFLLLIILALLAKKVAGYFLHNKLLKRIPGLILLTLGLYAFIQYLF